MMNSNLHYGRCMACCLVYHDSVVPKDVDVVIATMETKHIIHIVY